MTTPNNAAAIERLAEIERDMRSTRAPNARCPPIDIWADELSEVRTALAQPDVPLIESVVAVDAKGVLRKLEIEHASQTGNGLRVVVNDALTSQPSVEPVAWRVANHPSGPFALRKTMPYGWAVIEPLFTHPSSDAPGVAVDEVERDAARFRWAVASKQFQYWLAANSEEEARKAIDAAISAQETK